MFHRYLPSICFLTSKNFLDYYIYGKKLDSEKIKEELFLSQRNSLYKLPNQIHYNNMDLLYVQNYDIYDVFFKSLNHYQNIFKIENDNIYIKPDYFEIWQKVITKLNPIPILTKYLLEQDISFGNLKIIFEHSSLPSINNKELNNHDFSELHIHINGTSEMIYNWVHLLENPTIIKNIVRDSYVNNILHYKQLGINNNGDLYKILIRTVSIRKYFIDYFNPDDIKIIENIPKLDNKNLLLWKDYLNINESFPSPYTGTKSLEGLAPMQESKLWYKIFKKLEGDTLKRKEKENFIYLLHFYILSMSLFNKFLVQQLNQYGFSQFQFLTDNKLRDSFEDKGFKERYLQLKGMYKKEDLNHLELRFAPKDNNDKLQKLYKKLISEHLELKLNKKVNYTIGTIAHFIKRKDDIDDEYKVGNQTLRRWPKQRVQLEKESHILFSTISSLKRKIFLDEDQVKYFESFEGIDAAGNELYVRPEAFAPSFLDLNKKFRDNLDKILNITFHAGEDYIHLISGIRYIYEAIHFLEMDKDNVWNKKRIGHATALGIDSLYWSKSLDRKIVMSKGDYLDDLIFIKILLSTTDYDSKIIELWEEVYQEEYNYINVKKSYELRKEDPYKCNDEIIRLYNSPDVIKRYNELQVVSIDKNDIEIITKLQREVLKIMKENNILIESMITSNVRISYYSKYEEHHIFRWLFPEEEEKNIMPDIVLASDDPGLFNNNMRIEFCHLYEILKNKYISEDKIKEKVELLQSNSRLI